MDEKRYLLDENEASAQDLIWAAKEVDPDFGSDGLLSTSEAARILREYGYTVEENPNYTKEN